MPIPRTIVLLSLLFSTAAFISQRSLPPKEPLPQDRSRMLHAPLVHLGDDKVDWKGVAAGPEGTRLDIEFEVAVAAKKKGTICFTVHQYHVDDPWSIQLNGKIVGKLDRSRAWADHFYEVPARHLKKGKNILSFVPSKKTDDIVIGRVRLYHGTLREMLRLCRVEIQVKGPDGRGLAARITILDKAGKRTPLYYGSERSQAVRPGICYVSRGQGSFEIPEGEYRIYATHGPEWGLAKAALALQWGSSSQLELELAPEVETQGFISCDTHIHTLTYSGHGDASMEERMATLSGEGVDLAIATDHNHQTDYQPLQRSMELSRDFKAVIGNEVSTRMGHFNAWPLPAFSAKDTEKQKNVKRPEWRIQDWVKLIEGIRAKGAQAVVLNHPRWPNKKDGPYGRFRLNPLSGDRLSGPAALTFDAMELVNSTTLQEDPLFLVRDWFALLNHGERIMAVGSSDSHTVGKPVGQGRTYLSSSTDTPSRIRVDEVTQSLVEGRSSVSMGIFSQCWVNKTGHMGDIVKTKDEKLHLRLRIAAPSWIEPGRALVFLNGQKVAEKQVPHVVGKPTNEFLEFELAKPRNDAWLVCICIGKPPGPWWPTMNAYSFSATNPVWLDVDGNGSYSNPRELAEKISLTEDPIQLSKDLARHDDAVAVQVLSIAWSRHRKNGLSPQEIHTKISDSVRILGIEARPAVQAYLDTITPSLSVKKK